MEPRTKAAQISMDANLHLKEKKYWLEKLSGELTKNFFPYDYPPGTQQDKRFETVPFSFTGETLEKLMKLANNSNVRLHIILVTVLIGLLHKYTSSTDITTGAPIKKQSTVGEFINTVLILRNQLDIKSSFKELLLQVSRTMSEANNHVNYPIETLLYQLNIPDTGVDFPLFDTALLLEDIHNPRDIEHLKLNMVFTFSMSAGPLSGELKYNALRYRQAGAERIALHFRSFLEAALSDINTKLQDINILSEEEVKQLVIDFNNTDAAYPADKTVHRLFAEQVQRTPDRIAAVCGSQSSVSSGPPVQMTYRELNENSNRLAQWLIENGVEPDTIVGIKLEPSLAMLTAVLGILKSGAAYLPIDLEYPQKRIDFMLKDSGARVLLASPGAQVKVKAEVKENSRHPQQLPLQLINIDKRLASAFELPLSTLTSTSTCQVSSANLAYVIYTSGTTGKPKGTLIEHRNVVRLMINDRAQFDFNDRDVWTLFHSYCFDFSVWEMYGALLYGGKLVIIPRMVTRDPERYREILKTEAVTILNQTPSAFYNLMDIELKCHGKDLKTRYVIFGGEALSPGRLKEWKTRYPGTRLINMYGITETTVHVTFKEITNAEIESDKGNIGKPIPTLTAYILGLDQKLLPLGVPGEICIGGDGVSRGYLNNPELTAEKFKRAVISHSSLVIGNFKRTVNSHLSFVISSSNKHSKAANDRSSKLFTNDQCPMTNGRSFKLYKTGDLARWWENGDLEYLGRNDNQVKIRGHRIELKELESRLVKFEPVKDVLVAAHKDSRGENHLVAYMVPDPEKTFTICRILEMEKQDILEKHPYYQLPNGMPVFYRNRGETDFMYREVFEGSAYLRQGLVLEEGACVFDVGANIGIFSLFALQQQEDVTIYAFEPIPPIFEVLTLNTSIYKGNIECFQYGLSDKDGEVDFTYYPYATVLSGRFADTSQEIKNVRSFMRNQPALEGEALSGDQLNELLENRLESIRFNCQVKTLSRVIREKNVQEVDLLKIDVEKSEIDVLKGIEEEDWIKIRQIAMEVHNIDGRLAVIIEMLKQHGYEVTFDQDKELQDTDLFNIYARQIQWKPGEGRRFKEERYRIPDRTWCSPGKLIDDTREFLRAGVPGYMIPSIFVLLEDFPLTPNGKVDRKALPDPEVKARGKYVAPANDVEDKIAGIWKDVLKVDRPGVHNSFFNLGGTSINVLQVNTRLRNAFNLDIPVAAMFEYPTIRALSKYIIQKSPGGKTPPDEEKDIYKAKHMNRNKLKNRKKLMTGDSHV